MYQVILIYMDRHNANAAAHIQGYPDGALRSESRASITGKRQNSESDHVGGFAVSRVVTSVGNRRVTAGNTG